MLITNHILAGSLIGLNIKEPSLAIILSLSSHFVMDALPHFGYPGNKGYPEALKYRLSYVVGVITFLSTILIILFLMSKSMWFALICGLVAASPDIVGWYNYAAYEKGGKFAGGILKLFHVQFHRGIQKFERTWGIYIEIVVFTLLLSILLAS